MCECANVFISECIYECMDGHKYYVKGVYTSMRYECKILKFKTKRSNKGNRDGDRDRDRYHFNQFFSCSIMVQSAQLLDF